jgi:hypothetical protein
VVAWFTLVDTISTASLPFGVMQTSDSRVSSLEDIFGGAQVSGIRTINGQRAGAGSEQAEGRKQISVFQESAREMCLSHLESPILKNQGRKVIRTQAGGGRSTILTTIFCCKCGRR